jgi:hypothetical protein
MNQLQCCGPCSPQAPTPGHHTPSRRTAAPPAAARSCPTLSAGRSRAARGRSSPAAPSRRRRASGGCACMEGWGVGSGRGQGQARRVRKREARGASPLRQRRCCCMPTRPEHAAPGMTIPGALPQGCAHHERHEAAVAHRAPLLLGARPHDLDGRDGPEAPKLARQDLRRGGFCWGAGGRRAGPEPPPWSADRSPDASPWLPKLDCAPRPSFKLSRPRPQAKHIHPQTHAHLLRHVRGQVTDVEVCGEGVPLVERTPAARPARPAGPAVVRAAGAGGGGVWGVGVGRRGAALADRLLPLLAQLLLPGAQGRGAWVWLWAGAGGPGGMGGALGPSRSSWGARPLRGASSQPANHCPTSPPAPSPPHPPTPPLQRLQHLVDVAHLPGGLRRRKLEHARLGGWGKQGRGAAVLRRAACARAAGS